MAEKKCWASIDKTTAGLDSKLNIYFDENKTGSDRVVVIRVSAKDGTVSKTYTLVQKKGEPIVYKNTRQARQFTKQGCDPETQRGEILEYVVEAGVYSSLISVEDANRKATEEIMMNGQNWANKQGECITILWFNSEKSATARKNDCDPDTEIGSEETLVIPAKTFSSDISQADADAKAQAELDAKKQEYANSHGTCTTVKWYNTEKRKSFTKSDCLATQDGTSVEYVVEARRFSSTVSQEDADNQALEALEAEGPDYANEHGECVDKLWYNVEKTCTKTKTNCEPGFIGAEYTYVVEAGKYTSAISQEDADAKADADIEANCQDQANLNGECLPDPNWFIGRATARVQKDDCDSISQDGSFVDLTEKDLDGYPMDFVSTSSQEEADALAEAAMEIQKQGLANEKGTCIDKPKYYGVFSMDFTKEDCADKGVGSVVTVAHDNEAITGGPFLSYESQEAANALAEAAVREQGQAIANASGFCTWTGIFSKSFQKNDCEEGLVGSFVTVSEKDVVNYPQSVQSNVSQADANSKAQAAVEAEGQSIANINGNCTDKIVYTGNYSASFTPNCPTCEAGVELVVTAEMVNGSPVTSVISQEDADAKAREVVEQGGQNYADKNGVCEPMSSDEVWEDVVPEETRCVDGKSQKKQHNTNECSPTFGEERWIDGGGQTCQWTGVASASIQKNDCPEGEGAGSFVSVTQEDMNGLEGSGYPYISFVSQEDANALAEADVNGVLGQQVANSRGECKSSGYYEQLFYKNDCGSCKEDKTGYLVTSDMTSGYPYYDDNIDAANAAARAAVEAEGQAIANKNSTGCVDMNLDPVWADSDPLETRCNNGNSEYKQVNTNPCYGGEQERWVPGGGQTCQWVGVATRDFNKECIDGGAGSLVTVTQDDVTGGPFISLVSQDDANALAQAAVDAQGQGIANATGTCTWTGTASGTFTRNNCGTCQHGASITVNQDMVGGPFTSNVSLADANAKAQAAVNANGQAYANKNASCLADDATASWVDTGTTQCSGCTSQKQQRDTNSCSSSYNQTRWVNGGSRDCSENGTWGNKSYGSCDGCSRSWTQTNSCGGSRSGSDDCTEWRYYGTGNCVGHTRYDAYRNSCTGEIDREYSVDCYDCCNCGGYGSWQENGCSGTSVKYIRYDDCGNPDTKTEQVCGKCGYSGSSSANNPQGSATCRSGVSQRQYCNECGSNCVWKNEGTACSASNDEKCKSGCSCATCVSAGSITKNAATTSEAKTAANNAAQSQANSMTCKTLYNGEYSQVMTDKECQSLCGSNKVSNGSKVSSTGTSCTSLAEANNNAKSNWKGSCTGCKDAAPKEGTIDVSTTFETELVCKEYGSTMTSAYIMVSGPSGSTKIIGGKKMPAGSYSVTSAKVVCGVKNEYSVTYSPSSFTLSAGGSVTVTLGAI